MIIIFILMKFRKKNGNQWTIKPLKREELKELFDHFRKDINHKLRVIKVRSAKDIL